MNPIYRKVRVGQTDLVTFLGHIDATETTKVKVTQEYLRCGH